MKYYNVKRLEVIFNTCINNGVKVITPEWISNLNSLSLAIWYQDDGSWGKVSKKVNGDNVQRRASFSVCGFDSDSCELLVKWLQDSYGIKSRTVMERNKYRTIRVSHASTIKLWKIISPFMVLDYKIDQGQNPINNKPWIDVKIGTEAKKLYGIYKPPKKEKMVRLNLNSKNLRMITYKSETLHLCAWAKKTNIKRENISKRLNRGWTVGQALGYESRE